MLDSVLNMVGLSEEIPVLARELQLRSMTNETHASVTDRVVSNGKLLNADAGMVAKGLLSRMLPANVRMDKKCDAYDQQRCDGRIKLKDGARNQRNRISCQVSART